MKDLEGTESIKEKIEPEFIEGRNIFWEESSHLDPIGRLYKKSLPLGLLIFSLPTVLGIILVIFFPWPLIPQFTLVTIFSDVCLFIFIHVASFLTYYWEKQTFYDYYHRFNQLRHDGIIRMGKTKFNEYFTKYDRRMNVATPFIIVASILMSLGLGFLHYLYFIPYLQFVPLILWSIEWTIVWFCIPFIVFSGLKNIILELGLTRKFAKMAKEKDLELKLNPLHRDRFGGLSEIGEIAVETSFIVTVTVLLFPWFLDQIRLNTVFLGGAFIVLLFIVITIIITIFLITFFIPTLYIYYTAKNERNELLESTGDRYDKAFKLSKKVKKSTDQEKFMQMGVIINTDLDRFIDTERMRVFPFSRSILTKLLTGFLIPILFLILQEILL